MQAFGGLAGLGYGGNGYGAPAAQAPVTPAPAGGGFGAGTGTATGEPDYAGYVMNSRDLRSAYQTLSPQNRAYVLRSYDDNGDGQLSEAEYGRFHWEQAGQREGRRITPLQPSPPPPPAPPPPPPAPRTAEDVAPLETDLAAFGVNTSPEQPFVDLAGADLRTQQLLGLDPNSTVSDYQEAEALTDLGASELFDLLDQRLGGVTSSEVIDPRMAAEFGGAANARDYAQQEALAFNENPYYKLMFDEGLEALNQSVSSRGLRDSGYGVKAAMDYGQEHVARGYADEYGRAERGYTNRLADLYGRYFDDRGFLTGRYDDTMNRSAAEYADVYNQFPQARGTEFDRYMRMLDVGRGATQSVANAGSQYGANVSNIALANAQAQGSLGIANASIWGDAIGSVGQTIAGLPWGDWFKKTTPNPQGPSNTSNWGVY